MAAPTIKPNATFRTGTFPTVTSGKANDPTDLRNIYGDKATGDTYKYNNKDYTVFSDGNVYYILKDDNTRLPVVLTNKETPNKSESTTETKPSGTGGATNPGLGPSIEAALNSMWQTIKDLKKPNVMSAQELAEIYGWDYNRDNILKNLNEKTEQYYDDLITEQNINRNQYVQDNAAYNRSILNAYADAYANAARTRSGNATRAANILGSMITMDQANAENDYGMMQSVNNLEEAQKAELANNPYLAEEAYNTLGLYASQLSANLNASQVQQYADKLESLSEMYAADRAYQATQAQAAATKYSGLANAAINNAQAAGNSLYDNFFQYFLGQTGNSNAAAHGVWNTISANSK